MVELNSNHYSIHTQIITKHLFFHHSNHNTGVEENTEKVFQQATELQTTLEINISYKLDYAYFVLGILQKTFQRTKRWPFVIRCANAIKPVQDLFSASLLPVSFKKAQDSNSAKLITSLHRLLYFSRLKSLLWYLLG